MRIDAHQHFWKYDAQRDAWITGEMSVLKRDFVPEDLRPELEQSHVDACIAVQADQSERETEFLLGLAEQYDWIVGVVGWVDLCAASIEDSLLRWQECKKLRGVRHILQAEPDQFFRKESFLRGISCLKHSGMTYDVLIYSRQLSSALELVNRFPEQRFVIDHIAKPEIRRGHRLPWAEYISEIARNPNVYCKVSGMITEADWHNWSEQEIHPYLDVVFEAFGMDRIMFGSDWPVCLLAGNYRRVIGLVESYTESLAECERQKLFGGNAACFYGV